MPGTLRLKRNTKANIGTLQEGEPFWCTDENVLYVGDGSANHPAVTIASLSLDADITTLSVPASTTITTFAKTFLDDADAAAVRTTLEAQVSGSYQTLDATLTALAALTLTQGMLLTATGADAPSVLAKGTANHKLFMNAGATAPEWASGSFAGSFTRDMTAASGDVAYTGVGFKGSSGIFISAIDGTEVVTIGVVSGTTNYSLNYPKSGGANWNASSSLINARSTSGNVTQNAIMKSWDADGFTLTWTLTNTEAGTLTSYYLVFR